MEDEKLTDLLERLKKNREVLSREDLLNDYKLAYDYLLQEIKTEAIKLLKPICFDVPDSIKALTITKQLVREIIDIAERTYQEMGGPKRIGHALFHEYDTAMAEHTAKDINKEFIKKLEQHLGITLKQEPIQ